MRWTIIIDYTGEMCNYLCIIIYWLFCEETITMSIRHARSVRNGYNDLGEQLSERLNSLGIMEAQAWSPLKLLEHYGTMVNNGGSRISPPSCREASASRRFCRSGHAAWIVLERKNLPLSAHRIFLYIYLHTNIIIC